jgi:hypothetical protein
MPLLLLDQLLLLPLVLLLLLTVQLLQLVLLLIRQQWLTAEAAAYRAAFQTHSKDRRASCWRC